MPSLTIRDQRTLLIELECWICGQPRRRNYCRTCDEFFYDAHNPGCRDDLTGQQAHGGHRTY